jgi:hypothetical protein
LPGFPEVPTLGFGYPFVGSKLSLPKKPLSAPNALKLCPSEFFSSRMIKGKFPFPFSTLAFPRKTLSGLTPTLQRFDPTRKAVPLNRNPAFYAKSGTSYSLGFHHLSGALSEGPLHGSSPSAALPSHSSVPDYLAIAGTRNLRVFLPPARYIPPKRAPACLMFWANCHPPPLWEVNSPLNIFSSRGPKTPYGPFSTSLRDDFLPA